MELVWTGDAFVDSQTFARAAFDRLTEPDEDLMSALLFWREARLAHVEALDPGHFATDESKSNLWERVVPRLIRERRPEMVSHIAHVRSTDVTNGRRSEDVIVSLITEDFVHMAQAPVVRRLNRVPSLGEWAPYPESPDLTVKSWINDAIQDALADAYKGGPLSRLFRRRN